MAQSVVHSRDCRGEYVESVRAQSRIIKFGVFEVDLQVGELRKSGMRQKLAGQPFQVLKLLLEHPQQVLTREQLKQHIWPDNTVVDYDLALKKAINRIREVLGDSAESPRYIETIPRRGYRFIAPFNGIGITEPAVKPQPAIIRRHRFSFRVGLVYGLGVAGLLIAILSFKTYGSRRLISGQVSTHQIHSLAVLPLQNLSSDPSQEYFSDGMTDGLITDLAQIGSVKVISRTSSMRYKQTSKSLPEIARELKVDAIVEGTVQRSGDRVRITAQLIDGSTDKHLWVGSYERQLQDVFSLQVEVTDEIARQIQTQLGTSKADASGQPREVNLKTVEAYLQGKYHLDKFGNGSGEEELLGAKEYFQQAIDADPDFAPAYVGMASVYDLALHPSTEDRKLERRAAEKAVELDPTSSDGLIMLAEVNSIDLDWQRVEQEYRRAILLNPNSASAHQGLCEFLAEIGRLQEAWGECQTAQVLDPNNDHLSLIMYLRGNHDGAIELLLRWSELHPNNGYAHLTLHRWYAMKGIYKESIQHLEQGLILYGYPHIARRVQTAFAVSGYRGAMREFVTQIEDLHARNEMFSPMTLAQGYAALGDKDRAFYWLNRAYEDRARASGDPGLCWLKVYPMLDPLRSDPRYRDLLRRVGFPTQPFS